MPQRILIVAEKDTIGLAIGAVLCAKLTSARDHIVGKLAAGPNTLVLVTWPNGHAVRLLDPAEYRPEWGTPWRQEVLPLTPPDYVFRYAPKDATFMAHLHDWLSRTTELVNACDGAREGELIFHELLLLAGPVPSGTRVTRMWVNANTPKSLQQAWDQRDNAFARKYQDELLSALSRQQADWLWGINGTRKVSLTLGRRFPKTDGTGTYHIGRVQTPVLKIMYDRGEKIRGFRSEEFYRLHADFTGSGGPFRAQIVAFPDMRHGNVDTHFRKLTDAQTMQRYLINHLHDEWSVQDQKPEKLSEPPPPFDLNDLQQSANLIRTLRFTAKETLDLAQRLYHEEKAITYPRTDSSYLREGDRAEIMALRETLWTKWARRVFRGLEKSELPPPVDRWFDDSKVTDHTGIIPTGVVPEPLDANGRLRPEYQLWQLITMRFLHAWLPPARILTASRVLLCPLDTDATKFLRAFLECAPVVDAGWMEIEEASFNTRGHGVTLELLRKELIFPDCTPPVARLHHTFIDEGHTTPPERFNDAMLLREMNTLGLGTPATRAPCLEELIKRGYVWRTQHGRMDLGKDGIRLIELLAMCNGHRLCDPTLTASWEKQLERMTKRVKDKPTREGFLGGVLEELKRVMGDIDGVKDAPDVVFCPDTGKRVVLHENGRQWQFFGKYKDAVCYLELRGRKMGPSDYRDIFVGGKKGGGPFAFLSKTKGTKYEAWVLYRPKRRGYEQWEIKFKNRGYVTRSASAPQSAG